MFARTSLSLLSLAILAVAYPGNKPTTTPAHSTTKSSGHTTTVTVTSTAPGSSGTVPASSCSTGDLQCCNSLQSASDPAASLLLGLLGIVVQGVDVLVGLTCSPITVIGVGSGSSCSATAVCCQDNSHGNLISIGCLPVTL